MKQENQEKKSLKRERPNTLSTPMPPLKTTRGANGQTIYHLDSDDEDGVEVVEPAGDGDDRPREEIEVVTL